MLHRRILYILTYTYICTFYCVNVVTIKTAHNNLLYFPELSSLVVMLNYCLP